MRKGTHVEAVVTSLEGKGGRRYVVTKLTQDPPLSSLLTRSSRVTFSISDWKGDHEPKSGQVVELVDVEKFERGWRAREASPVRA